MTAPMMRARQQGGPCTGAGHGSRCEPASGRRVETRARERGAWRRLARAAVVRYVQGEDT